MSQRILVGGDERNFIRLSHDGLATRQYICAELVFFDRLRKLNRQFIDELFSGSWLFGIDLRGHPVHCFDVVLNSIHDV